MDSCADRCESDVANDPPSSLLLSFLFRQIALLKVEDDGRPFTVSSCPSTAGPMRRDGCASGPTATLTGPGTGPTTERFCGPTALLEAGSAAAAAAVRFLLFRDKSLFWSTIAPSLRHCASYCRNISIKSGIGSASGRRRWISARALSRGIPTRLHRHSASSVAGK